MPTSVNYPLGDRSIEWDAARLRVLLSEVNLPPGATASSWGGIMYIPHNGGVVQSFPVTTAGRDDALTAAGAGGGGLIWVPAASGIAGAWTLPASTVIASMGNKASFTGKGTISGGDSGIKGITVNVSGADAVEVTATSGIVYINDCQLFGNNGAEMNGAGGTLYVWNSYVEGTSGVGVKQTAGTVYITEDGEYRGTAGEFSGAVSLFSLDDVIKLKTSTFTKLYNATSAGIIAAAAAASSGDTIRLPDKCAITLGSTLTNPSGVLIKGGGYNSLITGTITNNGRMETLRVAGNVTNAGQMRLVRVEPSTGTGITQSASSALLVRVFVQMGTGVTYGIDISDGYCFHTNVGTDGGTTNTGIYVHGANVEVDHGRFAGYIGGKVEQAYNIANTNFYGSASMPDAGSHGLVHATGGAARLSNCSFMAASDNSYGINISNTGLTLTDCNWDNINGENYITYGTGDRSPANHTHTSSDVSTFLFAPFSVASDGAWSWFADPRAIHYNGKTYFGYITSGGAVGARSYNHSTGITTAQTTLKSGLTADDHNNPSFLIRDSDKRILAFYCPHSGANMYLRISTNPEDISAFGSETDIASSLGGSELTYPIPLQLLDETNDPIYLFWRNPYDVNSQAWWFSKSTDGGSTWAARTELYRTTNQSGYIKVVKNTESRIDFVATDGHPYYDTAVSVYHFYYEDGNYYQTDGTLIAGALPLEPADLTQVYDGTTNEGWLWDIAINENGDPVITFVKFISTTDHRYMYASWDGSTWQVNEIAEGGTYIADDLTDDASQVYYSGGVILDHNEPSSVFLSKEVNSTWEIYKYTTPDGGTTWTNAAVTDASAVKNIRPVAIYDHPDGFPAAFLSGTYTDYLDYSMAVKFIYDTTDFGSQDEKVKVSENDAASGYLNGKLVAGSNITLTEGNDGGDETLTIATTTADEKSKVSANDTTAGYLNGKLIVGTGINFTENNDGANETLTIASDYEVLMADGELTATPLANDEDTDWLYGD